MAYRAQEYVPDIFQPDDRRISDLIYAQSNAEAQRIRNSGITQMAMWRGMGEAASGALSDLAKYKREAPIRAEAERVRKEKDKLRGLEQFAGAGGLDEEARGTLLKKEGFVEKGQEILDKDASRKATAAVYKDAQDKRNRDEMSEITFALDQIRESKDPVAAYNSSIKGLKEKWKGKLDDMPDSHDSAALDTKVTSIQRASDVAARNARAEAASKKLREEGKEFNEYVDAGTNMMKPLIRSADTEPEWNNMWANFDARTKHLSAAEKQRIEDALPYKRQFSKEHWQQSLDMEDKKDPTTPLGAAYQMFEDRYHRRPTSAADQAEINNMIAGFTRATHVPAAGRQGPAPIKPAAKQLANDEKNITMLGLEKKFRDGDITEEELEAGKNLAQSKYLAKIGADDGPSLAVIEGYKGKDVLGRSLAAQALPGAAREQAAPRTDQSQQLEKAKQQGNLVWMSSSDGKQQQQVPAIDVEYHLGRGGSVIDPPSKPGIQIGPSDMFRKEPRQFPQEEAAPPPTQAGPPPQSSLAPPPTQQGGPGGVPNLPQGTVAMQSPDGRVMPVPPDQIAGLLTKQWRVLTPPGAPGAAAPAAAPPAAAPAAPPAAPESVEMVSPNGVRKIIEAKDVEQMLKWKWKIAPPAPPQQSSPGPFTGVGSRIWRDLTTGAPRR